MSHALVTHISPCPPLAGLLLVAGTHRGCANTHNPSSIGAALL